MINPQRQVINARIKKHLQYRLAGDYKVLSVRTRSLGSRNKEKYFAVDYFCISKRFVGGLRYERVAVTDKHVRTIEEDGEFLI